MKKNIKKIFGIFLISLLFIGFAAGTNSSSSTTPEITTNQENSENTHLENVQPVEEIPSQTPTTKEVPKEIKVEAENNNEENKTTSAPQETQNQTKETFLIPIEDLEDPTTHTNATNSTEENKNFSVSSMNNTNTAIEKNSTNLTLQNNTIQTETFYGSDSQNTNLTDNTNESTPQETQNEEVKKIKTTLSKNEKIELEGEIPEDFDINKITKKESMIDMSSKEVIVKSEEHLEDPLTVYTDIPEIEKDQISSVEVFWVNEQKEVEITGFYDLNENGLYDRISWVVPHLSEQIFKIKINLEEKDNTSPELIINLISPSNGTTMNSPQVEFNFSINYTNANLVECNLSIYDSNSFLKKTTTTTSGWETVNLEDGQYSWLLYCFDTTNESINSQKEGSFSVNENYFVETPDELYVLDWNNNLKGSPNTLIDISSSQNTTKEVTVKRDSTQIYKENITGPLNLQPLLDSAGDYSLQVKFYRLSSPTTIEKNFSVAKTDIIYSNNEAEVNENVNSLVQINSPKEKITSVILKYGDGSNNVDNVAIDTNNFDKTFTHKYSQEGNYTTTLDVYFNGKYFSFTKNGIQITDPGDKTPPTITLYEPENNLKTDDKQITFSFKANDNVKVKNCTYELYFYDGNTGTLDYSTTKTSITQNQKVEIKLTDFEEGDYSWNVYCCDNSSNCNDWNDYERDLTIDYNTTVETTNINYEQKDEISETIDLLEEFLSKMDQMSPEETQALEDLGIAENLTYYQKRLFQIDQDLSSNLNYVKDGALKEKRKTEELDEYEKIKNKIPQDFKILDDLEFTKNSITKDLQEIISEYSIAKNLDLSEGTIKTLAELNFDSQRYLKTQTFIKELEIKYKENTEKFILVTKQLELENQSFETVLESLPEDAGTPIFLTEAKKLNDNLYEIPIDSLEDDKMIYKIEESVSLDKLKDTDTVLFRNFVIRKPKITGFFALDLGTDNSLLPYIIFLILALILLYVGRIAINKIRMAKWKKEEDVNRILEGIKKAKYALQKNNLEETKEIYHKIKEIYPLVPEGFRKHTYKELKKIRVGIDRREIIGLVKEYEKAKSQGRVNDEKELYENVKETYKRLPKKDQEKIYNKMFKSDWEI